MYAHNASDRPAPPYNTAYVRDDRSHLYREFDIDPSQDDGTVHPETGERDAPADLAERRAAILSFYGHRCGRCLTEIARGAATTDADVGYLYSVADATGNGDRWALEELVAVCEPCYEVLSIEEPARLDAFGSAYRDSQQFPQWLGDPRVAVERIPLSGRERWLREQLSANVDDESAANRPGAEFEEEISEGVNRPVADAACLARTTDAATAVALGERLAADAWRPIPPEQRLTERWEGLSEETRVEYERRAEDWRALVDGSFLPARY